MPRSFTVGIDSIITWLFKSVAESLENNFHIERP